LLFLNGKFPAQNSRIRAERQSPYVGFVCLSINNNSNKKLRSALMQTLSEQVFSSCCHGQGAVLDTAGGNLSESREKRNEFLTAPHPYASRGEPKAKLLGSFSFGTLLWTEQRAAAVNPKD
jgi:hypothetical protein